MSVSGSSPTITFNGISSGIPVNDIIDQLMSLERQTKVGVFESKKAQAQQKDAKYGTLIDKTKTLATALAALKPTTFGATNYFQQKAVTSSNESVITASASSSAALQNVTVRVEKLATATKAASLTGVGALATTSSPVSRLAGGNVSTGNFTVFIDGVANSVSVDKDADTLGDVLDRIKAISGITDATVGPDGKLSIEADPGVTMVVGTASDTSNFLKKTALSTGTTAGQVLTASLPSSTIDLSADVEDNAAAGLATAVTAGSTFKIGGASFSTAGKTLSELITEINNSEAAGVTASYNTATNKVSLTSKSTGNSLIALEDTTGNFLSAVGLISGTDTTAAQTAGSKAEFFINGVQLYSNSNTVDESESGIAGLTLQLKGASPGSDITLNVARDTEELKKKLEDFVTKFNDLSTNILTATDGQIKGVLMGDSGLTGFRFQLRSIISGMFEGTGSSFNSLAQLGISTGEAGTGTAQASATLLFSASAFEAALASDPAGVEALMIGTDGIISKLKTVVDASVYDDGDDAADGLLVSRRNAQQARIKSYNESIDRAELQLEKREASLRKQFNLMEQLITKYQSQQGAVAGLANSVTAGAQASG